MGKTKTAFIGETLTEDSALSGKAKWAKKKAARDSKKQIKDTERSRSTKVPGMGGGQRIVAVTAEPLPEEAPASQGVPLEAQGKSGVKKEHKGGKKYLEALAGIDKNKSYPLEEAVDLAKGASTSRFDGTIELHLSLAKKGRFEVMLPHTGSMAQKRIEIATDETVAKLENGQIDFAVLIATPEFMPKLIPFAKLLGPKGLMPNPKSGTIASDPKSAVEKFSGGTQILQTEKDFPLIHTVVGKVSDTTSDLTENTQSIFQAIGIQNIKSATLAPTMGPGIKIAVA